MQLARWVNGSWYPVVVSADYLHEPYDSEQGAIDCSLAAMEQLLGQHKGQWQVVAKDNSGNYYTYGRHNNRQDARRWAEKYLAGFDWHVAQIVENLPNELD